MPRGYNRKHFYHRVSVIYDEVIDRHIAHRFSELDRHNLMIGMSNYETFANELTDLQTDCIIFTYSSFKNARHIFDALRRDRRLSVIPVAVLADNFEDDEEAIKAGVDEIIEWPCKKSRLILKLKNLSRLGDLEQNETLFKNVEYSDFRIDEKIKPVFPNIDALIKK